MSLPLSRVFSYSVETRASFVQVILHVELLVRRREQENERRVPFFNHFFRISSQSSAFVITCRRCVFFASLAVHRQRSRASHRKGLSWKKATFWSLVWCRAFYWHAREEKSRRKWRNNKQITDVFLCSRSVFVEKIVVSRTIEHRDHRFEILRRFIVASRKIVGSQWRMFTMIHVYHTHWNTSRFA